MDVLQTLNKDNKNKERRHVSRCKNIYETLKRDRENNEEILKAAKDRLEKAYWQRANSRVTKCGKIWFETAYDFNYLYTNRIIENNDQKLDIFDITVNPDRVKIDFFNFFSNIAEEGNKTEYRHTGDYPKIDTDENEEIRSPPHIRWVVKMIEKLPRNSAPGKDGINYDLYKEYKHTFARLFCNMYNWILEGENIPQSMKVGVIRLLPKKKVTWTTRQLEIHNPAKRGR